jgi:hypothetical protein
VAIVFAGVEQSLRVKVKGYSARERTGREWTKTIFSVNLPFVYAEA